MTDILISENILGAPIDALKERFDVAFEPELWKDPTALAGALAGVRAWIVRNQTKVTGDLVRAAKDLRIVARAGVGLETIDVAAVSEAGVVLSYTPSQNSISVAELTVGLLLSLARKIPAGDRHVKGGGWDRHGYTGVELFGKTLGVVGFGRIGFLTAMRARAFGMDLLAYDPYVDPDGLSVAEARPRLVELDELLAESDYVTCHLPGGQATRGLFDYERFRRMKRSAFFVNVARGEVVDEAGLIRALEEGEIAGAALDVRATEPPEAGPLGQMENVILMPHIGAFTREAQLRTLACVARDVTAVLGGEAAASYVNFSVPRR
jgi:D-3-phosphoglycerate dehydrogenase